MAILANNAKLIKVGQDYSAGSGISIDEHVISVTGELGNTYSAGDNIDIYEKGEQLYISSKDWSNDIANASANALNEAISQIPDPFDPTFISAKVDNKLDTTAFTNWQNGQYSTDLQTIEGQISNKLEKSEFSQVSSTFLTAINIPESAVWQDVSTTVQTNSAQWSQGGEGGDTQVNSFVYNNSAKINDVNSSYQENSGTFLTAINIPESAVWQDVSTTVQTNSAQWSEVGTDDEEVNSFVYNNSAAIDETVTTYEQNSASYLTEVPTGYAVESAFEKNAEDKITAYNGTAFFACGGEGDVEVNDYVQNNSATINEVNTTYQTNSGSYQPSGNYIPYTAVDKVFNTFQTNSGLDIITAYAGSLRSTSLREDFITVSYIDSPIGISNHSTLTTMDLTFSTSSDSAYVDMEKIHTWDSASNYIQNISSTLNDTSDVVQTNSANWGGGVTGEFVPQSAFDELKQSYDALSSLFATYSGQWLLPNEGV